MNEAVLAFVSSHLTDGTSLESYLVEPARYVIAKMQEGYQNGKDDMISEICSRTMMMMALLASIDKAVAEGCSATEALLTIAKFQGAMNN